MVTTVLSPIFIAIHKAAFFGPYSERCKLTTDVRRETTLLLVTQITLKFLIATGKVPLTLIDIHATYTQNVKRNST